MSQCDLYQVMDSSLKHFLVESRWKTPDSLTTLVMASKQNFLMDCFRLLTSCWHFVGWQALTTQSFHSLSLEFLDHFKIAVGYVIIITTVYCGVHCCIYSLCRHFPNCHVTMSSNPEFTGNKPKPHFLSSLLESIIQLLAVVWCVLPLWSQFSLQSSHCKWSSANS